MIEGLERILRGRGIKFKAAKRRIRYDYILSFYLNTYGIFTRCFPHIVNLACKAVLGVLTKISLIDDTQEGYEDYDPTEVIGRDCIATIRSLITTVCDQKSL